jgi:hypothetical protein
MSFMNAGISCISLLKVLLMTAIPGARGAVTRCGRSLQSSYVSETVLARRADQPSLNGG